MTDNTQKTYRLDLMYVGTSFLGWQSQTNGNTVQDNLEKAIKTILREEIRLIGASRTDSGVHALHQVATFRTTTEIDLYAFHKSLNALTPDDIGIRTVKKVPADFHPIISAKGKAYRYRLWFKRYQHPFLSEFTWQVIATTKLDTVIANSKAFRGTHDFSSFCAGDSAAKTKERTIFEIKCDVHDGLADIWIIGDGFLKQMVRTIVGTLVGIANGSVTKTVDEILLAKDRSVAGITAPAQGLSLVEIFYDELPSAKELITRVNQNSGHSFL